LTAFAIFAMLSSIGFRMERNLNKLGIYSLKDLRDYPKTRLIAQFGIPGHHLYQMGQLEGSWKENFTDEPLKSIGHMYTVTKEYRRASTFEPLLYKLSEMVAARLRVNKLSGNVLSVHMHDAKRNCAGASKRLSYQLSDGRDIFLESRAIFRKGVQGLKNFEVYLIGVTVAALTPEVDQPSLFASENNKLVVKALDKINEKYGDFTIARVPAFQARDIIRDSVGFGRMKEFKTTPARTNFGH
jgi:nucleotidyltransferase/DNA polymerase involved in DNA repair